MVWIFSFVQPWVLWAFCLLPGLWWLTPGRPLVPKHLFFPPVCLLVGLESSSVVAPKPDSIRLLVRGLLATFLIVGLADPHYAPLARKETPQETAAPAQDSPLRIGLVTTGLRKDSAPLLNPLYYVRIGLLGRANIQEGTLAEVLESTPDLIIGFSPLKAQDYLASGGWVLEIAQDRGQTSDMYALASAAIGSGAPQKIGNFSGPLRDLDIPSDVHILRSTLSEKKDDTVWAWLEEGTPLITAESVGAGMSIRLHTSLRYTDSDLAFSAFLSDVIMLFAKNAKDSRSLKMITSDINQDNIMQDKKDVSIGALCLLMGLCLFLVDWAMCFYFKKKTQSVFLTFLLFATLCIVPFCLTLAQDLPLVYIGPQEPGTQKGLEALTQALSERTTLHPTGVRAIDPAEEALSPFAFIYWPQNAILSTSAAQAALQNYVDDGGILILETPKTLEDFDLVLPPLEPVKADHVLARSFYRLSHLETLGIWVEPNDEEALAHLIVLTQPFLPALAQKEENALRLGINMSFYAVTGTYKAF